MKIRNWIPFITMTLGLLAITVPGCIRTCDEPDLFESGDYVIVEPAYQQVIPGDEWFLGGQLHVDRQAQVATIRYTRDGTTYEVHFTLEE